MPSPNCSPEAKKFLARIRTSFWALSLKDTCALGMSKLDEVFSEEGKALGWNEVSRAHLLYLTVLHQSHLGGIEAILKIESEIDTELEAVGQVLDEEGAAADLQLKEAFFVLQRAKMSVLSDRNAYGYSNKPLAAIHAKFGEEARKALFAESREACKAYISLLCLNFNSDCDEYQMSDKQVQANIDLAMSLNSEFLEAKHAYSKYTPKIQIWQLKNSAFLPSDSIKALLDDLLTQFPEGKHAISLYTFKSYWEMSRQSTKTQMNRMENQKSLEVLDELMKKHLTSTRKALGLETSEKDHIFYPARFESLLLDLNESCEKSGRKQTLAKLDRLHIHRSGFTGLRGEEDYELLVRQAQTIGMNPEFMIPELIYTLQNLVTQHRKVSGYLEKVNCYHDRKVFEILENAQRFFQANPRIGAKYPAVAEIEAEAERLFVKLQEADDAIQKEEGPEYSCFYNEFIFVKQKVSELRTKAGSKLELEKLREELSSRHSDLLKQIEAGETQLTYNCEAIGILEALLIEVLCMLRVLDSKYSKELKSLIETKLSKAGDFYDPLAPIILYFNIAKQNDSLTLEESEEVLALLKEVNSDLFPPCEHAELLKQFEAKITSIKLRAMIKNIDEIKDRLKTMLTSDPEFSGLQKKYEEEKRAFSTQIMDEDQRKKKDLKALEAEGCSRMNHFRKASEGLEFMRVFLPLTEEPEVVYGVMMQIRAEILKLEKAFFEEMRESDPDEFKVLSLTEEFLLLKAKYGFRLTFKLMEAGVIFLEDYVAMSMKNRSGGSEAQLEGHRKKCRNLSKRFPDVNSMIRGLEQQIAFDQQHPSLASKVEQYHSFITTLKLAQATKLFLELDPSNCLEAMAVYNEFKASTASDSFKDQRVLLNIAFNIYLIRYHETLSGFVQWAEENWKYAKYLPQIQRPSMRTVLVTTLVLGAAAVAWFKATSVKK